MISVEEAWQKIADSASPLESEWVSLAELENRTAILAEPVIAPICLPPFDNSAMDGYALNSAATQSATEEQPTVLSVQGEMAAGDAPNKSLSSGTAMQIMTGAAVPEGADAVLALEEGRLRNGHVEIRQPVSVGKHIRKRGEDVQQGAVLLEAGRRLNAQTLSLLSNSGVAKVKAYRQPRVSVLATGSELLPVGETWVPGKIFDSNRIALKRLLASSDSLVTDAGIVADDPVAIKQAIEQQRDADVILLSGGVSVGSHDYVKDVLKDLGMETVFWRVKMKPGKPLLCGRLGKTWVFGLPGNPISCVVGYVVFIEPLLRRMQGELDAALRVNKAQLTQDIIPKGDRRHYRTAWLEPSDQGVMQVTPTAKQGSAMMHSLAAANSFLVVPEEASVMNAGDLVDVLPFRG